MNKEILLEMLREIAPKSSAKTTFIIADEDQISILLSIDGALSTVDKVVRVELKKEHLQIKTSKQELYLLGFTSILGFKVKRSSREGTGFLPR